MKFLIAGFGSIGRRHFRNLVTLGEKDILFYRTNKSSLSTDELDDYPVFSDIEQALSQKPDAAIIANPTSLHLDVAIPAVEAGCHILMEKPLSNSFDRVVEFEDAVRMSGTKVLMGFQFRYHPGLEHIKRILDSGRIGRLLTVHAHWGEYLPDWHLWEDYRSSYSAQANLGGGVILTLCHPLDYLRWLVGEVEALWAFAGKLGDLDITVEDTAEIGLRFSNGAYGSVYLSYNQKPTTHKIELIGTEGTACWDNSDGIAISYNSETEEWVDYPLPAGFERNDLFLAEMRHFVSVIREMEDPVCSLTDGVRALELAIAAKQSAEQGKIEYFK